MPYSYPDDVPDYLKGLPAGAQKLFVAAYNLVYEETQDEDKSRIASWGAVKTIYEQKADKWVRKAKEGSMINLDDLETTQKSYAMHNRLHAEYLDARHTARRKARIQEDHETIVRHIFSLGGRHIPKGDALDDTLPQDLREAVKLRYLGNNLALEEAAELNRIQILRTGTFHHPAYGKFTITDDTLETMVKNFQDVRPKAPTELVVDFEHLSAGDLTDPKQGVAAGWVKDLIKQDGRLFADVEWNQEAAEAIKKKEFRFISPEFDLNYTDKETGKKTGPTLISVALTNRPFLEGMEPVVLSEQLGAMIFIEEAFQERESQVRRAYYAQFPPSGVGGIGPYVSDIFESYVIVEEEGALFRLPYTKDEDENVTFDTTKKTKVKLIKTYEEVGLSESSGVTEIEQKEDEMDKLLRELLGLGEGADVVEAVRIIKAKSEEADGLKAQVTELEGKITAAEGKAQTAEQKLTETEADKAVNDALTQGKIIPKMVEWAKAYVLRDPDGFKAFTEMTEKVGPDLTIKGLEGAGEETIQLTEQEIKIGERLGVSKEALMEIKKAEKEAS